MQTLVALDLETTGLDAQNDTIIEIGLVRFSGSRIEEEWSTLVNPGRPIPQSATKITGITDDMVAGAPLFSDVKNKLQTIIGNLPIVGHNVGFDLEFLRQQRLFRLNKGLDTLSLASVLMPSAGRYSLGALASALSVPMKEHHRALADAQATRMIFLRFLKKIDDLPIDLINEIARQGDRIDWGASPVFKNALQQRQKREEIDAISKQPFTPSFRIPAKTFPPLHPSDEPQVIDAEEIAATLEPGGTLAREFPGYEYRPQQVTMLRAVADSLSDSRHLLVEAGTGTGKSLAYLIPALAWAINNGRRVVISTNTINLQDQLIHKDIPDLCAAFNMEYNATVLKGRANYLCPKRLMAMLHLGPRSEDEMNVMAKILVWLNEGGSGDRSEITIRGPGEAIVWSLLSADTDDCSLDTCPFHAKGLCPYYQARQAAENAHVVIVNHALLLADIATGNRVIPEYQHLIVDEAHHLESAATQGLSFKITQSEIHRLLRDLANRGPAGLLTQLRKIARSTFPPDLLCQIEKSIDSISRGANESVKLTTQLFATIGRFLIERREGKPLGPYGQKGRTLPSTRTLPCWTDVEIAWDNLRSPLSTVVQEIAKLNEILSDLVDSGTGAAEDLVIAARSASHNLQQIFSYLDELIFEPSAQMIYWIELRSPSSPIMLHAAPLEVGPLVEQYLWHQKESIIMTSATLTTAGEFDYIRKRLYADDAEELLLSSPFDYETSTLLYLINDIPEPSDKYAYQRGVEQGLIHLCQATRGRTLALFTSYNQLQSTAGAISDALAANGIQVYIQGEGASRHSLLESFRSSDQAVLLGTRSFWEGIDVRGEALSVVAIIRLPFDVPSDPIIAARAETYESPFNQYMVPEAILRFRQGFGRLIRTQSDRGVVVSFDRRLLTKNYGRAFLDSLPTCTVRAGSLSNLPAATLRWLGD